MNAMVIYDSLHGNTEKIAHAIGEGLAAALEVTDSVEVNVVNDVHPAQLAGLALLLVGGPTHGSRPSAPMHDFLDGLPRKALADIRVAAFDTRTDMEKLHGVTRFFGKLFDRLGYAAPKISASLEKSGGQVVKPPVRSSLQSKRASAGRYMPRFRRRRSPGTTAVPGINR